MKKQRKEATTKRETNNHLMPLCAIYALGPIKGNLRPDKRVNRL